MLRRADSTEYRLIARLARRGTSAETLCAVFSISADLLKRICISYGLPIARRRRPVSRNAAQRWSTRHGRRRQAA